MSLWESVLAKQVLLLSFSKLSSRSLAICRGVCKTWKKIAQNEILWKLHLERRFPLSYCQIYRERMNAMRITGSDIAIENCVDQMFSKRCPYSWSQLGEQSGSNSSKSQDARFCSVCERAVYLCKTEKEFQQRTEQGDCVAMAFKWLREGNYVDFDVMGEGTLWERDSMMVMELLRENVRIWSSSGNEEKNDEKEENKDEKEENKDEKEELLDLLKTKLELWSDIGNE